MKLECKIVHSIPKLLQNFVQVIYLYDQLTNAKNSDKTN